MSKVSLKVTIAGRSYPLNVMESEQAKVMKAAEQINAVIETLSKNYAVKDPQDLLAMSALQLMSKNQGVTTEPVQLPADYTSVENALLDLSATLDDLK